MTPQSIGRPANELVLGKPSGRHAFRERLAELGLEPGAAELEQAFRRFKVLADKKKVVYNEDLHALLAEAGGAEQGRFELGNLVVQSGTFAVPTATVEMQVDGRALKTTAQGDGPVDAVY